MNDTIMLLKVMEETAKTYEESYKLLKEKVESILKDCYGLYAVETMKLHIARDISDEKGFKECNSRLEYIRNAIDFLKEQQIQLTNNMTYANSFKRYTLEKMQNTLKDNPINEDND